MTSSPTPFSDEELSLAIDGELDAARLAELDADAGAQARRDELAAAAARVGQPVEPLDGAAIDDLIATALDAPLAPAAPRRSFRGPKPGLVAAAVVLLVAIGLGLVWSGRNASEDRASFNTVGNSINAGDSSSSGAGSATDAATPELSESQGAPTSTVPAPTDLPAPVALGDFASGDELRVALASEFPANDGASIGTESSTSAPATVSLERCAQQLEIALELQGPPTRTGYGTVDGRAVLVYEYEAPAFDDGTPTTVVAAVGQDACDQVVIFQR